MSFNFMAAVTIHSDFGARENEVCHCFHLIPIREGCMMPNLPPLMEDTKMGTQQSGSKSLCEGGVQAALPPRWGCSRSELTLDASHRGSPLAPPDSSLWPLGTQASGLTSLDKR